MITLPNGIASFPAIVLPPPSKADALQKPKLPQPMAIAGEGNIRGNGDEGQDTLQKMLDDFKKMIEPWEQEIRDYENRAEIRDAISLDIDAGEEALQDYLAANPNREGPIDFSAIIVTLPENSPLRTRGVGTKSFQELMTHYKNTHKELELPALPTDDAGLEGYQMALAKAADMSSLPTAKDDMIAMQAAALRREEILGAMRVLAEKYGEIMKNMLLR
jgi:hypothetical protein